jgi:hypothetical protein
MGPMIHVRAKVLQRCGGRAEGTDYSRATAGTGLARLGGLGLLPAVASHRPERLGGTATCAHWRPRRVGLLGRQRRRGIGLLLIFGETVELRA